MKKQSLKLGTYWFSSHNEDAVGPGIKVGKVVISSRPQWDRDLIDRHGQILFSYTRMLDIDDLELTPASQLEFILYG